MNTKEIVALKQLWRNVDSPYHRDKIIDTIIDKADPETLLWFWNNVDSPYYRDKILDIIIDKADLETLVPLWKNVDSLYYRDKILDIIIDKADAETLASFLNNVDSPYYRDKILESVISNIAVNESNTIFNNNEVKSSQKSLVDNSDINTNSKILSTKEVKGHQVINSNKQRHGVEEEEKMHHQSRGERLDMSNEYEYDIFISHASEDKDSFVRALASALSDRNFVVWYDEITLTLGDSLRRSIDNGLAKSKYGLVVLSKNFFKKEWTQKELDALVAIEEERGKVILPIWHGVSKEYIKKYSPILADRLAVSTDMGLDHVVNEILKALRR